MKSSNNNFEIIVGTFVLLCAVTFFFTSFRSAKISNNGGMVITAKFDTIDGIAKGSDVKISGVKIGEVAEQYLDTSDFRAAVKMNIDKSIKLASDSSVKVESEGLLGSKYLSISPGADEELLGDGDEITYTQSSVNFETLLSKFIFSSEKKPAESK